MSNISDKESDKVAWGATLLVFGLLILLDKMGVTDNLPFTDFIQSTGTYFLAAGIIFLILKREKTLGIVFTAVGLVIHSDVFFGWMHNYRSLLIPFALIVVGVVMVLTAKKR